jgi:hypothetical protein
MVSSTAGVDCLGQAVERFAQLARAGQHAGGLLGMLAALGK